MDAVEDAPSDGRRTVRPPGGHGALAGAASVGLALGVTELLAGVVADAPSVLSSVGALVVDNVPPSLEDVAIGIFGTADKGALAIGTVLIAVAIGAWLGARALDRFDAAVRGFLGFGLLGALAVWLDPVGSTPLGVGAVAAGVGAGLGALRWLLRRAGRAAAVEPTTSVERRRFLLATAGVAAGALVLGGAGRLRLISRGRIAPDDVALPEPVRAAAPVGPQERFTVDGLTPVVVPNQDFYRIDTALVVPRIDADEWSLRVHGMVDRELTFTLEDLYARAPVERYVTLACVSNEVGGGLVGNAAWLGVPLAPILEEAGVQRGATQVVGRSIDGWTAGFPTELVFDGREPLIALGMNGEPLPADHGYPARLIVPGLYGYVSATKWLTEIELATLDGFDAYWIPRGWAKQAPIKLQSRIDVPRDQSTVRAGDAVVAGVAWSGLDGISAVDVAVDDGPWQVAQLTRPLSDAAWVQWRLTVSLSPGRHRLEVRATDAGGNVQTDEHAPPRPDGATGHHVVTVTAT